MSPYAYEWFIEGEVLAAKGDHDEAAIAFETARAAPSDDTLLLTRLAIEYERSGASRRADRVLATATRNDPESPYIHFAAGRIAQLRGEFGRALVAYQRARELDFSYEDPVIATAGLLRQLGQPLRAEAVLNQYIAVVPLERSAMARRTLLDMTKPGAEQQVWVDAGEIPPSTATERAEWIRALIASGNQQDAVALLSTSKSSSFGGRVSHAELFMDAGEWQAALRTLQGARDSPHVRYLRGRVFLALGQTLQALRWLSDVPYGTRDFEAARIGMADCFLVQARLGAAAEALSPAPRESLPVRMKLAEVYIAGGHLRRALQLFDAKRADERAALAVLFERAGLFDEAAAYYATADASALADPGTRARAGAERLAATGREQGAIAILRRWTSSAPEDLYARVRLVELLKQTGNQADAQNLAKRILPLVGDPSLRAHLVAIMRS